MNLKVSTLGIGLCVALSFGSDVKACDCVPSPPPHEAFAEADVVFRGKAIEVQDTSALPRWELRPFYFVVRFEVTTAWKGVVGREFALGTGRGGGDCGKSFKRGKSTLSTRIETTECHRRTRSPRSVGRCRGQNSLRTSAREPHASGMHARTSIS